MQSNYQASISDLNLGSQNPYGGPKSQPGQRYGQQQHQQPYDAPRPGNMNRFDSPYMRPQDDPHGGSRRPQGDAANPPSHNIPPRGPPGYPPSDPYQQPLGSYDPPAPARQRSPSPTPTEITEINRPLYDLTPYKDKKYWLQWRLVPWYIGGIILIAGFTLLTIYHKEIVNYIKPAADWAEGLKFGWLIPIAVLFVISFPPLFGHEIVAVICGLVWGLWVGFGIVCAGTLLGEIGNYYAFRYCCRARAEKMEKEKPYYDCLARVVREGGFKVALMARLSAIPGHFTTAIFATCGMNIIVFTIAAILSLPKQFITVYAGVVLEQNSEEQKENKPQNDTNKVTKIISNVVAVFSLFITFFALWWIYREMVKVKPIVFRERRKARLAKLQAAQDADRDSFGTNKTRVGSVRFDKYGGSVTPMDSSQTLTRSDEYEMRGRKREEYEGRGRKPINEAQFNANARQGQDGEEWSVESDVPLSTPAMKVEYDSYIGVDDRVPYGHAQGPTDQGYASKGQQYRGDYDGDVVPRPGQQPAGPNLQGAGQQYHQHTGKLQKRPPSVQRTGPGSEAPRTTPSAIPGPPPTTTYAPPPGPPPSSGPSVQRQVDPSVASGASEHMPQFFHSAMPPTDVSTSSYASSHVFERPKPPPSGAGFAKPVTMAPQHYPAPPDQYRPPQQPPAFVSPPSSPPNGPAQVTTSASNQTVRATSPPTATGNDVHRRKESSHAREPTEYLGTGHGHRGPSHATEASAYYSASEGEDEHDDRMTGLPPKTESRMPGQLFREQSKPQWH